MSNQDAEDLSQELANFLAHRSMQQFGVALKRRRTLQPQILQFVRALQTKYISDNETQLSPATVRKFVQKIRMKDWIQRRSLRDTSLKFARVMPLPMAPPLADLDSTEADSLHSLVGSSPEGLKANSLNPVTRSRSRSINEVDGLESKVNQSNFQILESPVQAFLSHILNIRIPRVRVYANALSDRLAKKYDADALAYPDKILFRIGKYDPHKVTGLALLGHELTHLEQFNRQDASSTLENSAIAEVEALTNERKVFRYISAQQEYPDQFNSFGFTPNIGHFTATSSRETQPSIPHVSESAQSLPLPRAALSDREIGFSPPAPQAMNLVAPLSELQLNSIKNEVYRDLRQRLRTEFERGS